MVNSDLIKLAVKQLTCLINTLIVTPKWNCTCNNHNAYVNKMKSKDAKIKNESKVNIKMPKYKTQTKDITIIRNETKLTTKHQKPN